MKHRLNLKSKMRRSLPLLYFSFYWAIVSGYSLNPTNFAPKDFNSNDNISLEDAFIEVSEEHGVYFSFDKTDVKRYVVDKSKLNKRNLIAVIKSLLENTNLAYEKVSAKNYVIFRKVTKPKINKQQLEQKEIEEAAINKRPQYRSKQINSNKNVTNLTSIKIAIEEAVFVNGLIEDETEQPMIGVAITLKDNQTIGTVTDIDGRFQLELPTGNEVLVISYLGYVTQEVETNGESEFNISMAPNLHTLDEVVVVGFGTQKKRYTTGAISKVSSDDLKNSTQTTVESALQGKVAGVMVTTSDAMAGSPVSVRIRGTSSIVASSEPLYVVDGVPVVTGNFSHNNASTWRLATAHESNALSQLNPNDIESIEVLKDASAAAIYGSRGANGVVLITTKRGKIGKTKYDVGLQNGFSQETNRIQMLNGPQYIALGKEAWTNSYNDAMADDDPNNDTRFDIGNDYAKFWNSLLPPGLSRELAERTNTDWVDMALQKGYFQEANLAASGGNDKTLFYLGGTYRDEKGIFVGNNFKRYNARVNLDHNPTEFLSIGARVAYTVTDSDIIPISWAGGLGTAQSQALPFWPVFNEDGTYFNAQSGNNVAAELANTEMNQKGTSILGNFYGQLNFLENFSLRSEFGINNIYKKESYYRSAIIEPEALSTSVLSESINWNTNNTLNYSNVLGNHAFDILAGMNATKNTFFSNVIDGETFPNPALKNPENAAIQRASVFTTQFSFLSFLGRLNYRFKEKYLLSLSVRRDGSSRFGPGNRWGTFPAMSLGWIVSDESFLAGNKALTFLKLRASAGITGNAEIGNFEYFGSFTTNNYVDRPGIIVQEVDNPGLGWESSIQYDVGIDFGLWDGRIEGGLDFYLKKTSDLLAEVNISSLSGVERVTSNVGNLENKGFDFSLTSHNLTKKFKWITSINLGYNVNKIIDLGGEDFIAGQTFGLGAVAVGFPVGARFLVPFEGIAPVDMTLSVTDPNSGESKEINVKGGEQLFLNQYGQVTNIFDPQDQRFIGNPNPVWIGGITNSLSYKNFDLSILFTFATGHDLANDEQRYQFAGFGYGWNMWSSALGRWQNPGDVTDIRRPVWGGERPHSTRFLYSADYARLKDITIGYNFPTSLLQKLKLGSARIFAKGTNLVTISKYPGWDPEYNRDGAGNVGQGKSWLPSPQAKSISFGLNVSF